MPYPRLLDRFPEVRLTIDDLEVGEAPVAKQIRPWGFTAFAPNSMERYAVIDFGVFP